MSIPHNRNTPASRISTVNAFRVMTVLERAQALEQAGHNIIHLEVGEPDFPTAAAINAAGQAALASGQTRYTPAAGLPSLRERLGRFYLERYGVQIDPSRILVTPGASGALVLLSQLLINPGDGVLMTDPGYPCNRNFVTLAGGRAQLVPVTAETDYQLSAELLDRHATPDSRGVWLASPGNPTGTVLSTPALQGISDWSHQHDCHLVVDEIYHGLDYVGGLATALETDPDCIVINSFSKYFGMTGWRLGWMVVPESLTATANILAQNLFIAASTVSQHAALSAFDEAVLSLFEQQRQELEKRRDYLVPALRKLGFSIPLETAGAFYIYAGIEDVGGKFANDSEAFCAALLEEQGVAITPGTDFGDFLADSKVRFAFTTGLPKLEEAVLRIGRFLEGLG